MSQRDEEGTSPGDSAPGDPINLVPESSAAPDFFAEGFPGKPIDLFADTSGNVGASVDSQVKSTTENGGEELKDTGDNWGEEVTYKDEDGGEEVKNSGENWGDEVKVVVENGGEEVKGTVENGEERANDALRDGEEENFESKIVERVDVKEAAMAESLINGLHQVEHGGRVGSPADDRDQQEMVTSQEYPVLSHQLSDRGTEKIVSTQKKADNGGETERAGGTGEYNRKPPLSGVFGGGTPRSSDGPQGYPSRATSGTNIVGDVLSSIASDDDEGRSRQRILAFAAKRYANAVERSPDDHDALYNWALVLQESADNTGPESGNAGKDALLEEACRKYEAATDLCPTLHEAFYNWAIAISDRAKIRGRTKEAEELWKQACETYDKSVQLNWNSPQALNNWGLALQELGGIVPLKEKRAIVKKAIRKFRSAIRLRFDFHRAVYNLGTVLYGLAEDTLRGGRKLSAREATPTDLYSLSAIYIAAAHALKPDYPVYRSALRLVRPMLPLPFVKAGYLTVAPVGDSLAPHSDWQRLWFVLNHEALYEIEKLDHKASMSRRSSSVGESSNSSTSLKPPMLRIEMEDIVFMTPCADLSLPPGGGFRIDTVDGHQFLIADTWDAMDGWVDAIRLVYTIFARGKRDSLGGVLAG